MKKKNVLLIGSGGREHAIAWKLSQSELLDKLYIAPGNPGTASLGTNLPVNPLHFDELVLKVRELDVELVIVGPEDPLVNGIRDYFDAHLPEVALLGPGSLGARLEGSKDFAKEFMKRHGIPTAAHRTFRSGQLAQATEFLSSLNSPYVIKADGLAAGKGVLICETFTEACGVLGDMLDGGMFGKASEKVVIEEFLSGIEMSAFVITDGKDFVLLPEAKDYKRIGEGDTGPNTGGMGSISPVPFAGGVFMEKVLQRIVIPTIEGLNKESVPYRGFIFFGLMNVDGDPYVIEYNVRLGDPETESILPRLESDLLQLCLAAAEGNLKGFQSSFSDKFSVTLMMVSAGYPGSYFKGHFIDGLDDASQFGNIFHAGTGMDGDGKLVTNGGRVLGVNALGATLPEALSLAYRAAGEVSFEGAYYRKDLGKDLI